MALARLARIDPPAEELEENPSHLHRVGRLLYAVRGLAERGESVGHDAMHALPGTEQDLESLR